MGQKIKLDDNEYDIEDLSGHAQSLVASLQFATMRVEELNNMQALLQRAKNSYVENLKKEMLSQKSGLLLSED